MDISKLKEAVRLVNESMTLLHHDFDQPVLKTSHIQHLYEYAREDAELAFWCLHILFIMSYGYLLEIAEEHKSTILDEIFRLSQNVENVDFGGYGETEIS